MDKTTTILFECLQSDLGCYVASNLDTHGLASAKTRMLNIAQIDDSETYSHTMLSFYRDPAVFQHIDGLPCRLERGSVTDVRLFRDVYQVLTFVLKVVRNPTNDQKNTYIEAFLENESETRRWRPPAKGRSSRSDIQASDSFGIYNLIRCVSRFAASGIDLSPSAIADGARHGPGATYLKQVGCDKDVFQTSFQTMTRTLGDDWFIPAISFLLSYPWVSRPCERHIVARTALVPKDYRGPRGVYIQPNEALFAQLGQMSAINKGICSGVFRHMHRPESQETSRNLALETSRERSHATIDLKDASDRVPLALVKDLFHRGDYVSLASTRPSHLDLPNGTRVKLAMFAPMGAATCFAVLTWVCCSVALAACLYQDGYKSPRQILWKDKFFQDAIRKYGIVVYGDDLIVRKEYADSVIVALQICNLKVNIGKSFIGKYFAESCGLDAYYGTVVTPYRLKQEPRDDLDDQAFMSILDLHNRLVHQDASRFERTIACLRGVIDSRLALPLTSNYKEVTGIQCNDRRIVSSHNLLKSRLRWNNDVQTYQIKTRALRQKTLPHSLDDWWHYNHSLFDLHQRRNDPHEYSVFTGAREGSLAALKHLSRLFPGLWHVTDTKPRLEASWVDYKLT